MLRPPATFPVSSSCSEWPNVKAEPRAASEIGKAETIRSRALALAPGSAVWLEVPFASEPFADQYF